MRSTRFQMRVVLTEHAKARMLERNLSPALILDVIDTGIQKDAGGPHCWLYKHFPDRQDNLLLCGRCRRKYFGSKNRYAPLGAATMKSIYFAKDDILHIRVSDKAIVREVSQDWHTNISYADDGTIVEIVLLDAKKEGLMPMESRQAA